MSVKIYSSGSCACESSINCEQVPETCPFKERREMATKRTKALMESMRQTKANKGVSNAVIKYHNEVLGDMEFNPIESQEKFIIHCAMEQHMIRERLRNNPILKDIHSNLANQLIDSRTLASNPRGWRR